MSEWFKELVLKTSDSKEPRVRIPVSPPNLRRNPLGVTAVFVLKSPFYKRVADKKAPEGQVFKQAGTEYEGAKK